jgi:hypothetical protein
MKYSAPVIYTENEGKNYGILSEYLIHLFSRIKPNYVKCLPYTNQVHDPRCERRNETREKSKQRTIYANKRARKYEVQLISVHSRWNVVMALTDDKIADSVI